MVIKIIGSSLVVLGECLPSRKVNPTTRSGSRPAAILSKGLMQTASCYSTGVTFYLQVRFGSKVMWGEGRDQDILDFRFADKAKCTLVVIHTVTLFCHLEHLLCVLLFPSRGP